MEEYSGHCVATVWPLCGQCVANVWPMCGLREAHVRIARTTATAHRFTILRSCYANRFNLCCRKTFAQCSVYLIHEASLNFTGGQAGNMQSGELLLNGLKPPSHAAAHLHLHFELPKCPARLLWKDETLHHLGLYWVVIILEIQKFAL